MANLFVDTLQRYRAQRKYQLHEFVVMPDHFHALLTPAPEILLERAVQLIRSRRRTCPPSYEQLHWTEAALH
jgi:putative transposase